MAIFAKVAENENTYYCYYCQLICKLNLVIVVVLFGTYSHNCYIVHKSVD